MIREARCPARIDGPRDRCHLPVGHDGEHEGLRVRAAWWGEGRFVLVPVDLAVEIRGQLIEHGESGVYDRLAECVGYPDDEDGPL